MSWDSRLIVTAFGAYAVKELASGAEIEAEVEIVCSLGVDASEWNGWWTEDLLQSSREG